MGAGAVKRTGEVGFEFGKIYDVILGANTRRGEPGYLCPVTDKQGCPSPGGVSIKNDAGAAAVLMSPS
jgi:hypothetical protein